jgi:hypothetical protein
MLVFRYPIYMGYQKTGIRKMMQVKGNKARMLGPEISTLLSRCRDAGPSISIREEFEV